MENFNLFARFTSNAKQCLLNAQELSKAKSDDIDTDDILVGIYLVSDSVGSRLLKSVGFSDQMAKLSARKGFIENLEDRASGLATLTETAKISL